MLQLQTLLIPLLPPRLPSHRHSVMTTTTTSIKSEEETSKEMADHVSTTEAAAKAEAISIEPPTLRQQPHPRILHSKESNQAYADGTESLETKLSNVQPIALNSAHLPRPKARETDKGDAGCERGHLLLFIIIQK